MHGRQILHVCLHNNIVPWAHTCPEKVKSCPTQISTGKYLLSSRKKNIFLDFYQLTIADILFTESLSDGSRFKAIH